MSGSENDNNTKSTPACDAAAMAPIAAASQATASENHTPLLVRGAQKSVAFDAAAASTQHQHISEHDDDRGLSAQAIATSEKQRYTHNIDKHDDDDDDDDEDDNEHRLQQRYCQMRGTFVTRPEVTVMWLAATGGLLSIRGG